MLLITHSICAFIILFFLISSVIVAIDALIYKKRYDIKHKKYFLITFIFSHIQLLLGLTWYIISPYYQILTTGEMGIIMKNADTRLLVIEHPITMVIAIIIITLGWFNFKKQTIDYNKYKTIAIYYTIALILILLRIPWGQWDMIY